VKIQSYADKLTWVEADDGMYLQVPSDIRQGVIDVDEIADELMALGVINADLETLEKVILRRSGKPEKVGHLFRVFSEEKRRYISLTTTPLKATLELSLSMAEHNMMVNRDELEFLLSSNSIIHGIDWSVVDDLVANPVYGEEVIVASATPPENGLDAEVIEDVKVDFDARPLMLEGGSVDFRCLDNIHIIKEGSIIARRIPPSPGKAGVDIFGKALAPEPGKNVELPAGLNTVKKNNNKELCAALSGYLYRQNGKICVGGTYIVKKDLDYSVGNVEYSGDVIVRGAVRSGFKIVATGNVTVLKEVENASILSKEGNIQIRGGIFGKNSCLIQADRGDIEVAMAQGASIKCGGVLTVFKYARNCHIDVKNLNAPSRDAGLINCGVYFSGMVDVAVMGAPAGRNYLVYQDNSVDEAVQGLKEIRLQEGAVRLEAQEKKQLAEKLTEKARTKGPNQAWAVTEVRRVIGELQELGKKLQHFTTMREKYQEVVKGRKSKENLVKIGKILPILEVKAYGTAVNYTEEVEGVIIDWNGAELVMRSF
jgi:hypothetical protein